MCDTHNHHAQTRSGWDTKFTASVGQWLKNSYTWFQAVAITSLKLCAIKKKYSASARSGPFSQTHSQSLYMFSTALGVILIEVRRGSGILPWREEYGQTAPSKHWHPSLTYSNYITQWVPHYLSQCSRHSITCPVVLTSCLHQFSQCLVHSQSITKWSHSTVSNGFALKTVEESTPELIQVMKDMYM